MRTIVIWGAGRIGRGFVAALFAHPDWRTVFVDIDRELVDQLNNRRQYTIFRATAEGISREIMKDCFTAVHTSDSAALEKLFCEEGLLLDIAVHATELDRVAGMIRPLIDMRAQLMPESPMDILMNVNMALPDEAFRSKLETALAENPASLAYLRKQIGISGIAAACISPVAPDEMKREDPLAVLNNNYPEQAVSEPALRGEKPRLPRLRLSRNLSAEETRKLYTLNMAHALLCYLGLPKGYKTVIEAMNDPALRALVDQALDESNQGLLKALPLTQEELDWWRDTVISLLLNPYIDDVLQRLGADTRRKLGRLDRLVGPACLCIEAGGRPIAIAKAIHAGLFYENDDPGTRAVRSLVKESGPAQAVAEICGLNAEHPLYNMILNNKTQEE